MKAKGQSTIEDKSNVQFWSIAELCNLEGEEVKTEIRANSGSQFDP